MTVLNKPLLAACGLESADELPLHGGDIVSASARFGIPVAQWLDLSTGLNPVAYPVPVLEAEVFQRLPYLRPEFIDAAANYYGNDQLMPSNGSQLIIQELPNCLAKLPVLLPEYGYQEHHDHWKRHGNPIEYYPAFDPHEAAATIEAALEKGEAFHLVIINPNNPTGLGFAPEQLADWARSMPPGGYMVIDEAFIDVTPEMSVLGRHFCDNMLVLRSFGKFFGLAGIRLGFVFAHPELRNMLQQRTGIWAVNGPAQALATQALLDSDWQATAQHRIRRCADATQQLFAPLFRCLKTPRQIHTPLFSSYQLSADEAVSVQRHFACQGILLRVIWLNEHSSLLRVGVLNDENEIQVARLREVIANYVGK